MTNGWGPAETDMSNGEQGSRDGHTQSLRGVTFAKGLGVHAPSNIKYNVGGCTQFTAMVGVDDEAGSVGSVVFQVLADGAKLYDSGKVGRSAQAISVTVDITGKSTLELNVTDGGDGNTSDHADWGNARITCK